LFGKWVGVPVSAVQNDLSLLGCEEHSTGNLICIDSRLDGAIQLLPTLVQRLSATRNNEGDQAEKSK
jgi:hypothetical protein